jgi:broad specificity phosphatase PhoE
MRVYLIRHGQTAWNAEGRAQGHTDIELDEDGKEQANALGRAVAAGWFVPAKVVTSDLARSAETARALNCPNTWTDKRLRERSFGEWEGMPFEDIHRLMNASGKPLFDVQPPSGESFRDVWHRLEPVAAELFAEEEPTAVVTHGGSCAILLAQLLKGTHATTRAFRFGNTAVTELHRRPDGLFMMVRYNDTSHLNAPAREGDLDGSKR